MKRLKYKKDKENREILKEIEKELGVVLMAVKTDDVVNGWINTFIEGENKIVDVYLYDYNKVPDFETYIYKGITCFKGSTITTQKKDIDSNGWAKLAKFEVL